MTAKAHELWKDTRMKKTSGFVKPFVILLALMGFICLMSCAGAESTERGLRLKIPVPQKKQIVVTEGAPGRRALLSTWRGYMYAETCDEVTWTLTPQEQALSQNGKFVYVIGVLDGTYPDLPDGTKIADTVYQGQPVAAATFSFTFYEPGEYVLFIMPCKTNEQGKEQTLDDKTIISNVHISKGGAENPLNAAVSAAVTTCKKADDFETALAINDYLCAKVTYDNSHTYYSAADALLRGTGVCNSYARAYEMIATACGLDAMRAVGTGKNDGHAWNAVRMDGYWYQLDVTWNDNNDKPHHLYFGLTDSLSGVEHKLENYTQGRTCVCNQLEDNYFVHTGKWRTILARGSIENVQQQILAGRTSVEANLGSLYQDEESSWTWVDSTGFISSLYGNVLALMYSREVWVGPGSIPVKGGFSYVADGNTKTLNATVSTADGFVLPEGLQEIEAEAFAGADCEVVILPDSCLTVGANAFKDCDRLVYVSCKEGTVFEEGAVGENVKIIRRK